jgi:phosphoglycolate phosphatase
MENYDKLSYNFFMTQQNDFSAFTHFFWDLDGTLTESAPGIINCVRYALESFGIHEEDDDKLRLFVGPPLMYSFSHFYGFDEEKSRQAMNKYRERFGVKGLYENSVYDGIHETLTALKNDGKKLYIATAKPEIYMFKIIRHFDLEKYFDFAGGSDLEETRSEKHKVIDYVIEHENLEEERKSGKILMIGDRKHDLIGAHKCGIKCCGCLWGYGGLEELKEYKADYIIEKPQDLLKSQT